MIRSITEETRRTFLARLATLASAGVALAAVNRTALGQQDANNDKSTTGSADSKGSGNGPFKLPELGYSHDALQPHIDSETMQLHHGKHHAGYVSKLNEAIAAKPELQGKTAEQLIRDLGSLPEEIRTAVRNNGGGHVNHSMFWDIMTPGGAKQPSGELAEAITSSFGSIDEFKKAFNDAGGKRFGSGWVWLVAPQRGGKLKVVSTPNQDNPMMEGDYPILGNDVWEHAYYLNYRNRRAEYLEAWWNVVNWDKVAERFKNRTQG